MFSRRLLFGCALAGLAALSVSAQPVVSVYSGLIHFFEGSVSIDGQSLEPKFGKFYDVKAGSELRTDNGRAEVLLMPGVFLRVDENSSIRMISNRLADTRVEFVGGAAALDSRKGTGQTPVLITYRTYRVRFSKPGRYRFDSTPPQLRVQEGEAEVAVNNQTVYVDAAHRLPFTAELAVRSDGNGPADGLDQWAEQRSASITASNATAAASDNLTSALNDPQSAGPYDVGGTGGYDVSSYPYSLLPPGLFAGSAMGYGYGYGYPGGISPYALYSMYAVPGFRYGAVVPLFRAPTYRPFSPIRIGTSLTPSPWRPPSGRYPTSIGISRPSVARPVVRGHR